MKCFNEQTLPVLSTLAKEYVLCDHWFSAVPGPTIPNRMFAHAGTSLGSVSQNPDLTRLKTIFELIDVDPAAANADYRIYRADATLLLSVAHLIENQLGFRDYNQFADDCAAGDLPLYSFIEPRFGNDLNLGLAASDQHPNHDAVEGERLIHNVYTAIRNNRSLWESTVLLIVYDEHGGIFDHIEPPRLNLPQPATPANPQFAFDRLGVRVPAVVVSAYVQEGGIDSTVYDHCSILAMFRSIIPGLQPLSYRDQIAMPFHPIVDLNAQPRNDVVVFPHTPASREMLTANTEPTELLKIMMAQTQMTLDSYNISVSRRAESVTTEQEAADFLAEARRKLALINKAAHQ